MPRAGAATACICARRRASLCDLLDRPARALQLARENWATQREPADARILLEAALAAGDPAAARPVLDWLERTGLRARPDQSAGRSARRSGLMASRCSSSALPALALLLALGGQRAQAERQLSQPERRRAAGRRAAGTSRSATSSTPSGSTADGDGAITWGEVRARHARHRRLRARAPCAQERRWRLARRRRSSNSSTAIATAPTRCCASSPTVRPRSTALEITLQPSVRSRPVAPRPRPGRHRASSPRPSIFSPERRTWRVQPWQPEPGATVRDLPARRHLAHLDRDRSHPVSALPAAARRVATTGRLGGTGPAWRPGTRRDRQGGHRLYRGTLDNPWSGGARASSSCRRAWWNWRSPPRSCSRR